MKILPAIMSGGAGTRLWPMSTPAMPKQFHALAGKDTMIQATATRFRNAPPPLSFLDPVVIASAAHRDVIHGQLADVGVTPSRVVLEPVGRNTAATALLAATVGKEIAPDALVLLLPADHRITNALRFMDAIARAAETARERIVTFGIRPSGPETGYGYIQRGAPLADGVFAIARFKEKPPREVAESLWSDGAHDWNAGIFLFAPHVVIEEFAHAPDIRDAVVTAVAAAHAADRTMTLPLDQFQAVPAQPFDIAVMEKTARSAVVPCDIGWADVGSWSELWRLGDKDADENLTSGPVALRDSAGCLVMAHGVPVAVSGLHDIVVVATPDGVLVLPRERVQDVKSLLEQLKAASALKG